MEGRYKIEKTKKKALVTVHLGRHFRIFGQYDYQVLKSLGYEVHIAANFKSDVDNFSDDEVIKHQISFARNPFSFKNIKAFFELNKIYKNNFFDIIQTQSPSAGVITRLSAIKERRKGSKVFYTPHGYHFYKGSSKTRWLIFYPIEKLMGKFTDVIITINTEDFCLSRNKNIGKKVVQIPGVGVDNKKFFSVNDEIKLKYKKKLKFPSNMIIMSYIGELSIRKDQLFILKNLKKIAEGSTNIHLVLVGTGELEDKLKKYVSDNNLESFVSFLGYRMDVDEILKATDIVVSSSRQEGLPVNIIESMFSGKPILASSCRGNKDLVQNSENGYVFELGNDSDFKEKLLLLIKSPQLRKKFGEKSEELSKEYSIKTVSSKMKKVYGEVEK